MSTRNTRRGFSLVELLAVVLILAVLAAVAVPLYINTQKNAAERTCKANVSAIAAAESAAALRTGDFVELASLVGQTEGLGELPKCPSGGTYSTDVVAAGAAAGSCTIECTEHGTAKKVLTSPKVEAL